MALFYLLSMYVTRISRSAMQRGCPPPGKYLPIVTGRNMDLGRNRNGIYFSATKTTKGFGTDPHSSKEIGTFKIKLKTPQDFYTEMS